MRTFDPNRPVLARDGRVLYAPNPPRLFDMASPPGADPLLTIGGSWQHYPATAWFDVVITVCGASEGYRVPGCGAHLYWPLSDDAAIDERQVGNAVDDVLWAVEARGTVLVRCYTGQNRSGLVVALAMRALYGMTGRAAVDHLRAVRSPTVLCNPVFERYVADQGLATVR